MKDWELIDLAKRHSKTKLKVKIQRSEFRGSWYAHLVGETFDVYKYGLYGSQYVLCDDCDNDLKICRHILSIDCVEL